MFTADFPFATDDAPAAAGCCSPIPSLTASGGCFQTSFEFRRVSSFVFACGCWLPAACMFSPAAAAAAVAACFQSSPSTDGNSWLLLAAAAADAAIYLAPGT